MNINDLERAGGEIGEQLDKIRIRIGAQVVPYDVKKEPIDIEIVDGEKIWKEANKKPNQPIIINDNFRLVYIKDHGFHDKYNHDLKTRNHSTGCFTDGNKVHFYYCKTLIDMTARGRKLRYRYALQISNIQIIDLINAQNVETRLAWCKNCISILGKAGGVGMMGRFLLWNSGQRKSLVAERANAVKLINCVESYYRGKLDASQKIRSFFEEIIEGH